MLKRFNIKQYNFIIILVLTCTIVGGCKQKSSLKLNEIQVLGSHNSYKKRIQKELWEIIYSKDSLNAMALDYGHIPLAEQLDKGLRGLEIDVFYDPKGGKFAFPFGQKLIEEKNYIPKSFDKKGKMMLPGLKIFHIQDIDFRSHCLIFKEGLKQLKDWSNSNPNHMPIIITINAKDQIIELPNSTIPNPFNEEALNSIDEEIRSVFSESKLITPDKVRKNEITLEKAILTNGWPNINDSKGKFLFVLDESGQKQEDYKKNHPNLKGRVMFATSNPGTPESAFLIINDPINNIEQIKRFVKLGYFVRTRADTNTWEARNNDYKRWEAALKSGAQLISTDYYIKDTVINTQYQIKFKNQEEFRLNPLFKKN